MRDRGDHVHDDSEMLSIGYCPKRKRHSLHAAAQISVHHLYHLLYIYGSLSLGCRVGRWLACHRGYSLGVTNPR